MKVSGICLLLLVMLGIGHGYKYFQDLVPNGSRVPHPCYANFVWHGLGHMNKDGAGMRNKFGDDFDKNGKKWDECLCMTDSDGDGLTNGEELGDPNCEWTPESGKLPEITALSKLSHPGVCEPLDSDECKRQNNFDVCIEKEDFVCDAFKQEGVMNFTLTFPLTPVPVKETTYMCVLLDVPTDGDWHVIGAIPNIDNDNVMHHTIVKLCSDEAVKLLKGTFDTPQECGMSYDTCTGSLPGWTVGLDGDCFPKTYGVPLGTRTGYTKALVQFHWNNPELKEGYTDQSGMMYFYEQRTREQDISGAMMGPLTLNIPPKQLYYEQSSVCSPECGAARYNQKKYITGILPHMHYMGRGFVVEHYRGDTKLPDLVNTNSYSYDNPIETKFDPPVEYLPGDKIIVRCFFNSMNQDKRIYFGEGTQDEMCLAFFSFYPPPGFYCFGQHDRTFCRDNQGNETMSAFEGEEKEEVKEKAEEECDFEKYFYGDDFINHLLMLAGVCDGDGLECKTVPNDKGLTCKDAISMVYEHHCMKGNNAFFLRSYAARDKEYGVKFLHLLHSCDEFEVQKIEASPQGESRLVCDSGAGHITPLFSLIMLFIIAALNM